MQTNGDYQLLEGRDIAPIACAGRKRNVDGVASARTGAHLFQFACQFGIPVVLMQRDEEYTWISIKSILRAVAVMNIPVNDHHTLEAIGLARVVSGGDGVVEDTEPHGAVAHSMMSRRAKERVGVAHLAIHHGSRPIHRSPRRVYGGFKRAGTERRIDLDLSPRAFHWPTMYMRTHSLDVFACVVHSQFVFSGCAGGYRLHLRSEASAIQELFDAQGNRDRRGM